MSTLNRLVFALLFCAFSGSAAAADDADSIAKLRGWLATPFDDRPALTSQPFARSPLAKENAEQARMLLWEDHLAHLRATRAEEWSKQAVTLGEHTLKWKQRTFGDKPKEGWNLYVSMHGGGNTPPAVNDRQWENQIKLYQPRDSVYIAPRAPTDTWNLWHEAHIDPLFARLIADAVALGDVNPNRIYLMGYSAGGDGVYQLAPRMADRFAAVSMMAGHPNDASPIGLRNIGFALHVGALDDGYGRNKAALEWKQKLDDLQTADPQGYVHDVQLHAGRAHWMNLEDAVAVDWMAKFTRNPLPTKVAWRQSSVTHDQFYWLALPAGAAKPGQTVSASREGQTFTIEKADGVESITLRLNDAMADLDQPIVVKFEGKTLFSGTVKRMIATLQSTLEERDDESFMFPTEMRVALSATR